MVVDAAAATVSFVTNCGLGGGALGTFEAPLPDEARAVIAGAVEQLAGQPLPAPSRASRAAEHYAVALAGPAPLTAEFSELDPLRQRLDPLLQALFPLEDLAREHPGAPADCSSNPATGTWCWFRRTSASSRSWSRTPPCCVQATAPAPRTSS